MSYLTVSGLRELHWASSRTSWKGRKIRDERTYFHLSVMIFEPCSVNGAIVHGPGTISPKSIGRQLRVNNVHLLDYYITLLGVSTSSSENLSLEINIFCLVFFIIMLL